MRQTIKFWLRCVRFAASGNVPYANDWQWVFANPLWQSVGAAVGGAIGSKLSAIWPGAPVIGTDTWAGVLLGGVAGFVITWLLFFAVRFVHAPSALFHAEMARANDAIVRFDALVSAKDDASRDTKIGDAIGYICYRRWGKDYGDAARSGQATGTSEYVEFLQAAADGHIPVWGKKSKSGVYEPVPASFWFKNQIEWFGLVWLRETLARNLPIRLTTTSPIFL
jgi:hypothetical protein